MPLIIDTTSGELDQYDVPLDIADSDTTTEISAGFPNAVTSMNPGSFSSTYEYDIVSTQSIAGHAYLAWSSSSMKCASSIAVLSRNNAFTAMKDSSVDINSCAALIAQRGIAASHSSSALVRGSACTRCDTNFMVSNSSSMVAQRSASIFPLRYGVDVAHNSSFAPVDFESMTFNFNSMNVYPTPTHFRSLNNSYCENTSYSMTSKTMASGICGSQVNPKPLNFVWSQISTAIAGTGAANILGNPAASYRFVPFSHSIDYSNVAPTTTTSSSSISTTGILSIIANGRNGYASVKPPAHMYKPEDGSGNTATGSGLTGDFSIYDLITSL